MDPKPDRVISACLLNLRAANKTTNAIAAINKTRYSIKCSFKLFIIEQAPAEEQTKYLR